MKTVLKAERGKGHMTYKRTIMQITPGFSEETMKTRKQRYKMFKVLKKDLKFFTQNSISRKVSFKSEDKTFSY